MTTASIRLYVRTGLAGALVLMLAAPAHAQYKPKPIADPATGEKFHIEGSASWWNPGTDMVVSSGGSGPLSGIAGTEINAKRDLGFTDKRLPELTLVGRPAPAHKLRFNYIPIKFDGVQTLTRDIVFNGQRYRV